LLQFLILFHSLWSFGVEQTFIDKRLATHRLKPTRIEEINLELITIEKGKMGMMEE
jgi:hypothetical protein